MFDDYGLEVYFAEHKVAFTAQNYINEARKNEPSRMVGVKATTNICSWRVSEKMGYTISLESRSAERAFLILSDNNENVLEIWDQPPPIKVDLVNKAGRFQSISYTPDFLLLTSDGPLIIEAKTQKEVNKLVKNKPNSWSASENGKVIYKPAEEAFSEIGIPFDVFVYSPELRFRIENLSIIEQAKSITDFNADLLPKIKVAFEESFVWTLDELAKELRLGDLQQLICAIDQGKLFFDFDKHLLSIPEGCVVTIEKALLPFAIDYLGQQKIFSGDYSSTEQRASIPSLKEASCALDRLNRINNGESGRSIRRWKAQLNKHEADGVTPFQALLPKYYRQGNRSTRVAGKVELFLKDFILNDSIKHSGISDYRNFIRYKLKAQAFHPEFSPVSKKTFIKRLKQVPAEKLALSKYGVRGGNAASPASDPKDRALSAQLPWQVGCIDHCLAKIYVVIYSDDKQIYVARPWLSVLVDQCTSAVLAFSISFQSPSRKSCAKVLRDCVRRHGKLPAEIIVDRGSEFKSVYFFSLLAHYRVDYSLRPSGHSRYGGQVEGFFGEFKKQWLSQRLGSFVNVKEIRALDGNKRPESKAVLTPFDFYKEFEAFCGWHTNKCRGYNLNSAGNRISYTQQHFPFLGRSIKYDDEFLIVSAVDSERYKIDFQRGLHIGELWFWSPELKQLEGRKKSVEVRIDPDNPFVVYGLINDQWVPCYSSHINIYAAKAPISQVVEGALISEGKPFRAQIREAADLRLAEMVKDADEASTDTPNFNTDFPLVESTGDEQLEAPSLFDEARKKLSNRAVVIEYWEGDK